MPPRPARARSAERPSGYGRARQARARRRHRPRASPPASEAHAREDPSRRRRRPLRFRRTRFRCPGLSCWRRAARRRSRRPANSIGESIAFLPVRPPAVILMGYPPLSLGCCPQTKVAHAGSSRPRKRAVRSGASPLQAHHRKNRSLDRAPRARVLRKADCGAQAQARGRREAPLQAPAQPATASEALLEPSAGSRDEGRSDSPLLLPMPLKNRITDDMKAAMRAREAARLSTIRLLLAAIKQREVD